MTFMTKNKSNEGKSIFCALWERKEKKSIVYETEKKEEIIVTTASFCDSVIFKGEEKKHVRLRFILIAIGCWTVLNKFLSLSLHHIHWNSPIWSEIMTIVKSTDFLQWLLLNSDLICTLNTQWRVCKRAEKGCRWLMLFSDKWVYHS